MLIVPQAKTYKKRRKYKARTQPAIPALELVTGVYTINDALITLTFNQPIDISAIDPTQFVVWDGIYSNQKLQGTSATSIDETTVQISLEQIESYSSSTATLDASATNGIVAVTGGAAWTGVTGYVLAIG